MSLSRNFCNPWCQPVRKRCQPRRHGRDSRDCSAREAAESWCLSNGFNKKRWYSGDLVGWCWSSWSGDLFIRWPPEHFEIHESKLVFGRAFYDHIEIAFLWGSMFDFLISGFDNHAVDCGNDRPLVPESPSGGIFGSIYISKLASWVREFWSFDGWLLKLR